MDNEIDRKIDVTAIQSLLVQNRQQTHNWTLIGSGAIGIGIQVCETKFHSINKRFLGIKFKEPLTPHIRLKVTLKIYKMF